MAARCGIPLLCPSTPVAKSAPPMRSEPTLAAFAAILKAVPRSRAVLKAKPFATASVRERYLAAFQRHGVARERLQLLGLIPHATDHLQT
jgi:predicted O-linked N-acetylglucosamine transferase (SPINDLY family)